MQNPPLDGVHEPDHQQQQLLEAEHLEDTATEAADGDEGPYIHQHTCVSKAAAKLMTSYVEEGVKVKR